MDLASPKINRIAEINGETVLYGTKPAIYNLPVKAGNQNCKEFEMKKKIVLGVVFVVLFVLQGQAVFAQNLSFQLDVQNGGTVMTNDGTGRINITSRIQYIGVQVRDSGMVIVINDGSTQTYAFSDIDEVDNGYGETTWSNIRKLNPNTGGFLPERFTGRSKIHMNAGVFEFHIINSQGVYVLQVFGTIRY